MKKLLFLFTLSIASQTVAMEHPKQPQVGNNEMIALLSKNKQEFKISTHAAQQSETIKNLIKDTGVGAPISLPNIDSKTLGAIVALLENLNALILKDEEEGKKSKQEKKVYIPLYLPRAFQPIVNEQLQKDTNEDIGKLFNAANYLDIKFLLNAIASVITDRILKSPTPWETLNNAQRVHMITLRMKRQQFGTIPLGLTPLIVRHINILNSDIAQEYSIADYIRERGQPSFDKLRKDGRNVLDLSHQRITSLFGIELLEYADKATDLRLEENCLGDLSLDPQPSANPFVRFTNLQDLYLNKNELTNLPDNIFHGLGKLQYLSLDDNQFAHLPITALQGLDDLKALYLSGNRLTNLPTQYIHDHFKKLEALFLQGNPIKKDDQKRIEKELERNETEPYLQIWWE